MQGTLVIANAIFFKEVKDILGSGSDVLFTINGNSMRPFLTHGDKVLISPIEQKDLTLGKIILANSSYGYVLHRLVWKNRKHIWLAGDNNLIQLEKVNFEDVLGFVKYAEINGEKKDVLNFLSLFLAGVWFFLRPIRLVIHKVKDIFNQKKL